MVFNISGYILILRTYFMVFDNKNIYKKKKSNELKTEHICITVLNM